MSAQVIEAPQNNGRERRENRIIGDDRKQTAKIEKKTAPEKKALGGFCDDNNDYRK